MSSVERNVAGECRFSGPVPCRPFLPSLFTSTLSINSFTGFCVHALSAEGYLSASCISAITATSSLGNRISLMQAMKPDRGSYVTMTLFSRWSNSGKSSSSSCDSRAVSSATARKSLACEATVDLPCSGSVELTRSCTCTTYDLFQCMDSDCYLDTLTAYNEFISQTTALQI